MMGLHFRMMKNKDVAKVVFGTPLINSDFLILSECLSSRRIQ